jgi:hypothetical protein
VIFFVELPAGADVPALARRRRDAGGEHRPAEHVADEVHADAVGERLDVLGERLDAGGIWRSGCTFFWSIGVMPSFSRCCARAGLPEQKKARCPSATACMR